MKAEFLALLLLASVFSTACKKDKDDDNKDEENKAPSCTLTFPVSGIGNGTTTFPTTETFTATASDEDGTVSKVEFYVDNVKVGEDLYSPYEYEYEYSQAGAYDIKARAVDNDGASTFSATVNHGVGL